MRYIRRAMNPATKTSSTPAEHWRCDAGSDSVAVLAIPGLIGRARVFDVDASLLVDVPADTDGAWLELTVECDGKRQWSRRIPAHNPGQTDGLDYHQRLRLEAEQGMRVRAVAKVKGVRVRQLLLEAREEAWRDRTDTASCRVGKSVDL
jgi:hypothetical protein